jgi:hypothetical protein
MYSVESNTFLGSTSYHCAIHKCPVHRQLHHDGPLSVLDHYHDAPLPMIRHAHEFRYPDRLSIGDIHTRGMRECYQSAKVRTVR